MYRKELPVFSVILYMAALVTVAGATVIASDFIAQVIEFVSTNGWKGNESAIIGGFMSQAFVYYVYALLLGGVGAAISNSATAARRSAEVSAQMAEIISQKEAEAAAILNSRVIKEDADN